MFKVAITMSVPFQILCNTIQRFHGPVGKPAEMEPVSIHPLDHDKGIPDMNGSSDNYHREIFTVYTIEVQKNYKGDIGKTMKLYVEGGLPGYREEEQCQLVQDANLFGFTYVDKRVKLEIGESYLLCANKHEHYTSIVNMDQFAYYLNSQKANEIIWQCRKK